MSTREEHLLFSKCSSHFDKHQVNQAISHVCRLHVDGGAGGHLISLRTNLERKEKFLLQKLTLLLLYKALAAVCIMWEIHGKKRKEERKKRHEMEKKKPASLYCLNISIWMDAYICTYKRTEGDEAGRKGEQQMIKFKKRKKEKKTIYKKKKMKHI